MIVFQPPTDEALNEWCAAHLGSPVSEVIFRSTHLSAVVGLRLADRREVVVKARPGSPRLESCFVLQKHLWQSGYACAEPLVSPRPLGPLTASAETYLPDGAEMPASSDFPRLFAGPLAQLVTLAASLSPAPSLLPHLPWTWWQHESSALWPPADDSDADLNAFEPAPWLDDIATRVRSRLSGNLGPSILGHGDWWPSNLRWQGDQIHAVHDWDSIVSLPEVVIAGIAASMYCTLQGAPTIEQSRAFLHVYREARGLTWTAADYEACWAAGLWRIAFDAKKESVESSTGANLEHLRAFGETRLKLAGA